MLLFSEPLPPSYQPRVYVVSDSDGLSEEKAHQMEERKFEREEVLNFNLKKLFKLSLFPCYEVLYRFKQRIHNRKNPA